MTRAKFTPREWWIRSYLDSQPDGFLSGNVSETLEYELTDSDCEGAIHVLEATPLALASPTMYAALEQAETALLDAMHAGNLANAYYEATIAPIRAALSLARGER